MSGKDKGKNPAESFGELIKEFGDAVGKIFDDPELKKKAKDFGDSAVKSAKQFGSRFRDEEVKEKFRGVSEAAREFGNSMSDYFKDSKKDSGEPGSKKKDDLEKKTEDEADKLSDKAEKTAKEFGEKTEKTGQEVDRYFKETRGGRITGYAFSIFFTTLFLVFLYYYNHYIAFYSNVDGTWERYSFLTGDFNRWLPVVMASLIASIAGNIILIIYDGYFFRQIIQIVMDMFGLSAIISLLVIFPFDFSVMPGNDLTGLLNPIVTVALILICVGIAVAILVRFIKMIVSLVKRS